MREYARIHRIIALLEVIWNRSPDLRLGQLLVNMVGDPTLGFDIYSVEDDVLEKELRKALGFKTKV